MGERERREDERVEVNRGEAGRRGRHARAGAAPLLQVSVQARVLRQAAASATLKESARGEERRERKRPQGEGPGK